MSKIAKNIAHLRKLKRMTQEAFSDELQIKKSRLGAYEESRSVPPVEILIKLSDYFKLPIDILIRRDLTQAKDVSFIDVGQQRVLFPITVNEENKDLIEVVDVQAKAGYLNGYADPEYIEELQRMKLPFTVEGKLRSFPIKGDSMPPISDGSYVVGRWVEDIGRIKFGTTYIVITANEGVVYKRLTKSEQQEKIKLQSDNVAYAPYEVQKEDILELWEFVCCICTEEIGKKKVTTESILHAIEGLRKELVQKKV